MSDMLKNKYETYYGPACLLTLVYAYGKPAKPRLPHVHKYSSLRSTAHRPASGAATAMDATLHALRRQYTSEGSLSSFKSITWKELW